MIGRESLTWSLLYLSHNSYRDSSIWHAPPRADGAREDKNTRLNKSALSTQRFAVVHWVEGYRPCRATSPSPDGAETKFPAGGGNIEDNFKTFCLYSNISHLCFFFSMKILWAHIECKSFTDVNNLEYALCRVCLTLVMVQHLNCLRRHQTWEVLVLRQAETIYPHMCFGEFFGRPSLYMQAWYYAISYFGGIKCANFWFHCSMNPFVHSNVLVVQVHMPSYARGWSTLLLIIPNQCHMVNGVP